MNLININKLKNKDSNQFRYFIKKYWKKNHIFSKDSRIFNWQYKKKNIYNFLIAWQNNNIIGAQGFVPLNHFDKNLNKNQIFLAFCRVVEGKHIGTMIKLQEKLFKEYKPKFIATIGLEEKIHSFHKWQGFEVKKMDHHAIFSKEFKMFKVAKFKNFEHKRKNINKNSYLVKLNIKNINFFLKKNFYKCQLPLKSNNYIINRYLKNPFYKYDVFLILKNKKPKALMVVRIIKQKQRSVIRFVDFIGQNKFFYLTYSASLKLLHRYKAEYIDIYSYGISKKILKKSGFINRYEEKDLIIPNHFEPYQRKNYDIFCAYKTKYNNMKIKLFKGDGDMDRPNTITKNTLLLK